MSGAKRRINSTGRKKISQERIDLRILPAVSGQPPKAKVGIDLGSLGLPASAVVSVEAYHRSTAMRFECGTVGATEIPDMLILNELDQSGGILFRIKVVDIEHQPGRILASADRLRPSIEGEHAGRKSIFPVEYRDLGQEVWRVDINDDAGPTLLLSSRIPALMHRVHENPLVSGSILPAAFRIVLLYLANNPSEEDDGWKADWKRFCGEGLGVDTDPDDLDDDDDDGKETWVDDVVRRYCETKGFVERARQMLPGQGNG